MLVYEFMGGGSVADRLFARGKKKGAANDALLSSEVRVGIVKGVAEALAHVHAAGAVHRDVKAANVLLSADMEAKLGDFGLLRLLKDDKQMTQTMTAAGTPGYSAPELLFTRTPSDKADVYSYGVLMLELACGRRAIDVGLMEEPDTPQVLLLDWVWSKHERGELMSVLDPKMFNGGRIDEEEEEGASGMWRCIVHLALRCCHPIPEERPPMKDVLDNLEHNVLVAVDHCRPVYCPAPVPVPRELVRTEVDDTSGPTAESSSGSCGLSSKS
jgi:serine/threonine protein kinase